MGREQHLKMQQKHPVSKPMQTKTFVDGTDREFMNVTINSVASSKKGSIFY
jgi:hypothetical protein